MAHMGKRRRTWGRKKARKGIPFWGKKPSCTIPLGAFFLLRTVAELVIDRCLSVSFEQIALATTATPHLTVSKSNNH
eukprot:5947353-Amphidinium_carterae.1